ncbi:hypothetical protein DYB35_008891 [Aphanomyces astaci]|uniref:PHD-type domain-containing protein n=1 Tax=Aphanomyces astaci TaxID=112090 RepID=A0A3R7E5E0_APHAT|nr:hypothetical protein DYB35_008891 [Aphanomyces astaci]
MTSVDMPMTSMSDKSLSYHGRSEDTQTDGGKSKHAKSDKLAKHDRSPVHAKKVLYPPRLLVDFNSLHIEALNKYVAFYQIPVREECTKDELAALVARHFDGSLEVEEDESILSFVTRVRNGEKTTRVRPPVPKPASSVKKTARGNDETKAAAVSASTTAASTTTGKRGREDDDPDNDDHADASVAVPPPPSKKPLKGKPKEKSSNDSKSKKNDDNELYCVCNLPGYGAMIACDGEQCPNPSQWYHLECVGFSDGQHPDTWFCPECDPKAFAAVQKKKKKSNRSGGGSGDDKSSKGSSSGSGLRR